MESKTVCSFSDYVYEIEELDETSELILFRGQSVQGNLLPSVCRETPSKNTTKYETQTLKELRRMGGALVSNDQMSDWDLLAQITERGTYMYMFCMPMNSCTQRRKGLSILVPPEYLDQH